MLSATWAPAAFTSPCKTARIWNAYESLSLIRAAVGDFERRGFATVSRRGVRVIVVEEHPCANPLQFLLKDAARSPYLVGTSLSTAGRCPLARDSRRLFRYAPACDRTANQWLHWLPHWSLPCESTVEAAGPRLCFAIAAADSCFVQVMTVAHCVQEPWRGIWWQGLEFHPGR